METSDFINMNSNNTLYLMYRNVYPCWPLIISAIAINLVAIFGMVSNFAVIWTTYHTKSLHGTVNFLLALCSFYELLIQHGHLLFLFVALSGQNFIPFSLAIKMCTISFFGLGGIPLSMAFTGFDRLLCVLFPTVHRKLKQLPYLCFVIFICSCSGFRLVWLFYDNSFKTPFFMVTGTIGDLTTGEAVQNLSFLNLLFNTITIVLYIIVGIVINKKSVSNSSTTEHRNRRIFRSLLIIILVNVLGYYLCSAYFMFVLPIFVVGNPIISWTITMFVGILTVNVSAASNGLVLYMTSTEYKKAFRHEFGRIHRFFRCSSNSSVAQIGANQKPINIIKMTMGTKTRIHSAF